MSKSYSFLGVSNSVYIIRQSEKLLSNTFENSISLSSLLSNSFFTKKQSIKYHAISFDNLPLNAFSFIKRSPLKYESQTVSSGSLITIIDRNQSEFPTVYGYIL